MGEYLHSRFKLRGEVLPAPGTPELEAVYLFPGENASEFEYNRQMSILDNGAASSGADR
jgi:hypothetical protein